MTDETFETDTYRIVIDDDGGILIAAFGGNRYIFKEEIREMCETDNPVTVR